MTEFEKWQYYYEHDWCTKEQLQTVVGYNKITAAEYETITGEPYPTA